MQNNRIETLDVIRGLCLLGILQANLLLFQYGSFGTEMIELFPIKSHDWISFYVVKVVVEGSFMPIFAFLFGYGMVLLHSKSVELNQRPKWLLARRFIMLMILGYVHVTYIWEGDILLTYGIVGLMLIPFVARKAKTLLIWSISLLVLSVLLGYGAYQTEIYEPSGLQEVIKQTNKAYTDGSYSEIVSFRAEYDAFKHLGFGEFDFLAIFLLMPIVLAPMFLVGMYAAKKSWFTEASFTNYRLVSLLFVGLGLLFKSAYYLFPTVDFLGILFALGTNLLTLGYIFLIAWFYQIWRNQKVFKAFASVGKLSLTNYLFQSIICTMIFYGYGLSLFGSLGVSLGVVLGLFIFAIQVMCSYVFLKK